MESGSFRDQIKNPYLRDVLMLQISSPQNPKVKALVKLRDSKLRRQTQSFLVEGAREIQRALDCSFLPLQFWICPSLMSEPSELILSAVDPDVVIEVSENVFEKIAVRESKDGVIAVFESVDKNLSQLNLLEKGVILAVQGLEKPGNLGAMIRTADGLGVDGLVLLDSKTDLWNPIAIRASLGSIFSIPILESSSEDFLSFCQLHKITTYAAVLSSNSKDIFQTDFSNPCAIILGTEDQGLSDFWIEKNDAAVMIPMAGVADSFNVSVAAGMLLYEAMRQRHS